MDFMNLNQSAHGDREFGFIGSRLRLNRKVVVGHWQDEDVQAEIGVWARAACAWADWQGAKVARFGDNMRDVAVTEGDKVEAQIQFGYDVYGYGVGDLVKAVNEASDAEIDKLVQAYLDEYEVAPALQPGGEKHASVCEGARIEIGMRNFLNAGNFKAFTTTFEDLHGLTQLPGLAVQRLMRDGYGFGAEGDWKTSALVRAMKVMSAGLKGGVSFMEDYTYHFSAQRRQGAGRAHARNLRVDRGEQTQTGYAAAFDRRQSRPGALDLRCEYRPRDWRLHHGYGSALPHGCQRGGCGPDRCAASQAAGGARLVAAASQSQGRRRGLDLCRRRASHQLQLFRHCRSSA